MDRFICDTTHICLLKGITFVHPFQRGTFLGLSATGGYLIAHVVGLGNKLPEYRQATGHLHFFTKDIAPAVLRDAGYDILDVFYCRQPIDTEPWNIKRPGRVLRKSLKIAKHSVLRLPANLCYAFCPDFAVRFFGGWRLMVLLK